MSLLEVIAEDLVNVSHRPGTRSYQSANLSWSSARLDFGTAS